MRKGSTHNTRGDMNRLSPRLNIGLDGLSDAEKQPILRAFVSLDLIERGKFLSKILTYWEAGHDAVRKY